MNDRSPMGSIVVGLGTRGQGGDKRADSVTSEEGLLLPLRGQFYRGSYTYWTLEGPSCSLHLGIPHLKVCEYTYEG